MADVSFVYVYEFDQLFTSQVPISSRGREQNYLFNIRYVFMLGRDINIERLFECLYRFLVIKKYLTFFKKERESFCTPDARHKSSSHFWTTKRCQILWHAYCH